MGYTAPKEESGDVKVLLVEESAARRKILSQVLGASGVGTADLLEAADPGGALLVLRKDAGVGLVVADWVQKGMDGLGFMKALRTTPGLKGVHVLFCVNKTHHAFAEEAVVLGKADYILRPFSNAEFGGRVQRLIEEIQSSRHKDSTRLLRAIRTTAEQSLALPFMMRLPSEVMQAFLRECVSSVHEAGEVVVRAGALVESLHVITLGSVEVVDDSAPDRHEVRGEGDCFGEVSLMWGEPSAFSVRAKTRVEAISLPAEKLADFVRRHPAMSQHLSGLMNRREQAQGPSGRPAEFSGNLEVMPLAEILQFLVSARKTGSLDLVHGGQAGVVVVSAGRLIHAALGRLVGEPAFMAMMLWTEASFTFTSGSPSGPETITKPTITLLMDAIQARDEKQRQAVDPPAA